MKPNARLTMMKMLTKRLQVATLMSTLLGCSPMNPSPNPYFDAAKPHHTPQGFRNNYAENIDKPLGDLLRWQLARLRDGLPPAPKVPTPQTTADLPFVHANATAGVAMQPAITWIGHATSLVQASGLNVLTDPVFSERASPVQFAGPKRAQAPGLSLAQLPAIDVVVISHNHYDHLDSGSIEALAKKGGASTTFIVPLGLKAWLQARGAQQVIELDWWGQHTIKGVAFYLTPVQHWSARGLGDRSQSLWGAYSVIGPDFHWYFSGDTGYSRDFVDTRERFAKRQSADQGGGFDLALIAVGAYEPRWFMKEQHVNPAEAVQIHRDLGAKRSVGVHWGTFELTDEPLDQPPQDLAAVRRDQKIADDEFVVLAIGETRRLPQRSIF